jgi:hypothetical protein
LPSGDTIGLEYYMDATNGTYSAPTLSTNFFLSNPGSFAVTGKVFAATQAVLNITPTQVTFENNGGAPTELYFAYNVINSTNPSLTPGANFTCTIFDGNTLIGSTSTVVGGGTSNGVTNSFAGCAGVYPSTSGYVTGNGDAFVNLPATYNSGDTYTFIISR